jgi:hypothetical protein
MMMEEQKNNINMNEGETESRKRRVILKRNRRKIR